MKQKQFNKLEAGRMAVLSKMLGLQQVYLNTIDEIPTDKEEELIRLNSEFYDLNTCITDFVSNVTPKSLSEFVEVDSEALDKEALDEIPSQSFEDCKSEQQKEDTSELSNIVKLANYVNGGYEGIKQIEDVVIYKKGFGGFFRDLGIYHLDSFQVDAVTGRSLILSEGRDVDFIEKARFEKILNPASLIKRYIQNDNLDTSELKGLLIQREHAPRLFNNFRLRSGKITISGICGWTEIYFLFSLKCGYNEYLAERTVLELLEEKGQAEESPKEKPNFAQFVNWLHGTDDSIEESDLVGFELLNSDAPELFKKIEHETSIREAALPFRNTVGGYINFEGVESAAMICITKKKLRKHLNPKKLLKRAYKQKDESKQKEMLKRLLGLKLNKDVAPKFFAEYPFLKTVEITSFRHYFSDIIDMGLRDNAGSEYRPYLSQLIDLL